MYTQIFNQTPQRGQSRLGLQRVDSSANAKGLAPGQLDMYTWQFCQTIRHSAVRLERYPSSHKQTKMYHIYILCTQVFSVGPQRERLFLQKLNPALMPNFWPQASWICTLGSIARASGRARSGWNAPRSLKVNKLISYFYFM
jgi:hypothetical protein